MQKLFHDLFFRQETGRASLPSVATDMVHDRVAQHLIPDLDDVIHIAWIHCCCRQLSAQKHKAVRRPLSPIRVIKVITVDTSLVPIRVIRVITEPRRCYCWRSIETP